MRYSDGGSHSAARQAASPPYSWPGRSRSDYCANLSLFSQYGESRAALLAAPHPTDRHHRPTRLGSIRPILQRVLFPILTEHRCLSSGVFSEF